MACVELARTWGRTQLVGGSQIVVSALAIVVAGGARGARGKVVASKGNSRVKDLTAVLSRGGGLTAAPPRAFGFEMVVSLYISKKDEGQLRKSQSAQHDQRGFPLRGERTRSWSVRRSERASVSNAIV